MENKQQPTWAEGIRFDRPVENSPKWIKGKISVNVAKFIEFIKEQRALGNISEKGYLNLDLKESKNKLLYLEVNTWKPTTPKTEGLKQEIREVLQPTYQSSLTLEEKATLDAHRKAHTKKVENWNAPNDGADFDRVHEELSNVGVINPEEVPF